MQAQWNLTDATHADLIKFLNSSSMVVDVQSPELILGMELAAGLVEHRADCFALNRTGASCTSYYTTMNLDNLHAQFKTAGRLFPDSLSLQELSVLSVALYESYIERFNLEQTVGQVCCSSSIMTRKY